MEITFIVKGALEILPPLLPRILYVADSGMTTTNLVCTGISQENRKLLEAHGVNIYATSHKQKLMGRRIKLMDWLGFRRNVKRILKKKLNNPQILYLCSADTALALGKWVRRYPFVLQSNELYDMFPMYKKGLAPFFKEAKVTVVPEYCRANICACWYGLKQLPLVIPNVPYVVSSKRNLPVQNDVARQVLEGLKGKRIVLYQGHIAADRTLSSVAQALQKLADPQYALVLMGTDRNGSVKMLKDIYPNTVHIPFVTPPMHLEITSHADIAVLSYDRVSLNNIFCAPNKIYEYSCYGIPMLGNDIPGLRDTVQGNAMGVCTAYEQVDNVVAALCQINKNYDTYRANALAFYEKSGLRELMMQLLDSIGD